MKSVIALIVGAMAILIQAGEAMACQRDISSHKLLCPGDPVVSSGNNTGVVLGVNARSRMVSIDLDNYFEHYSYKIEDIFLGFGCMYSVCVGDRVVSSGNSTGVVIGINPYKHTVSIDLDNYFEHYSYNLSEIFLGFGCVDGVCVGDLAVSSGNSTGTIIGVNPYRGTVSLDLDNYYEHYSYEIDKIFVSNECLEYGPGARSQYRWLLVPATGEFNFYLSRQQ